VRGGAQASGQRGVLDLLAVTRTKRLAILELKTSEKPDLPLQAAAYWLRIRKQQAQGELPAYGHFPGMELQTTPPLLSPEIEIIRVGLTGKRAARDDGAVAHVTFLSGR
jgi:hypothetical protein